MVGGFKKIEHIPKGTWHLKQGFGTIFKGNCEERVKEHQLAAWNAQLSKAIQLRGEDGFLMALEEALRCLVEFDICMIFSYGMAQTVRNRYHNMPEDRASVVIKDYMAWPYLLDPFYQEAKAGRVAGFCSLRDIAPDRFYQSEYFMQHYSRTAIADEMGIFFKMPSGNTGVLSVTRQRPQRNFLPAEKARFSSAEALVRTLCFDHFSAQMDQTETNEADKVPLAKDVIENAFQTFGKDRLSEREREVMVFVLKGHSTLSIALHLDITAGTVKNHRRNAYAKLGISSQAELFSTFVSSLQEV